MARTLVLFGPPGSGKGTQAARLSDDSGSRQLATGDLLREARAAGTELGQRAAEYMDRGDLVPDDVIVATVRDAIGRTGDEPIVLYGFPRSVAQADALADALADQGRELSGRGADRRARRRRGRADPRPRPGPLATITPRPCGERLRVYHGETGTAGRATTTGAGLGRAGSTAPGRSRRRLRAGPPLSRAAARAGCASRPAPRGSASRARPRSTRTSPRPARASG